MEPKINLGPFRFLPCTVEIDGTPDVEDWTGPLKFAIWCQRASPWWIGDLLNAGDARFGEVFSQACEGIISAEMLQRYESVARRVPPKNRRPGLSWSSHAAVARLPDDLQIRLLVAAEKKGWNSTDLRVQAREALSARNDGRI